MVSLSPEEAVLANVKTTTAKIESVGRQIEAFGNITYDTNKIQSVPLWIEGRLDRLYVKAVGDNIQKGDLIAQIYSPDIISTQKEYLYAKQNLDEIRNTKDQKLVESYKRTVESAKNRLKYMGLTPEQIDSNIIKDTIPVYSKYSGTVIELSAKEGESLKTGDVLFKLADFSTVWLEPEVNETDISEVKVGQTVTIEIESYPEKHFMGKVSYIYPFADEDTRTIKARIVLDNPEMLLKPDMYAKAVIQTKPQEVLLIPKSAVLYTGKKSFVWIEKEPGMYRLKEIQTGRAFGDNFEVLSGLSEGEEIVSSGGFLIDSEAKLK